MKINLMYLLLIMIFLFLNCQSEKEEIFGKSKETKERENFCNPAITIIVCDVFVYQSCINNNITYMNCDLQRNNCVFERGAKCSGTTYF